MEQNQFDGLEDIETQTIKPEDEIVHQKEYEKLLKLEEDRKNFEAASNLVKFGCFEQKEVLPQDLNFAKLEKSSYEKKYNASYDLYKDLETGQLLFILPLVENNQGDSNEDKSMKPYAYDVLFVEQMSEETYEKVLKAGRNNLNSFAKFLLVSSYVFAITNIVLSIFVFFGALIYQTTTTSSSVFASILTAFMYAAPLFAGVVISIPLVCVAYIQFKKYKEGK
jgi:hypothetical protein